MVKNCHISLEHHSLTVSTTFLKITPDQNWPWQKLLSFMWPTLPEQGKFVCLVYLHSACASLNVYLLCTEEQCHYLIGVCITRNSAHKQTCVHMMGAYFI